MKPIWRAAWTTLESFLSFLKKSPELTEDNERNGKAERWWQSRLRRYVLSEEERNICWKGHSDWARAGNGASIPLSCWATSIAAWNCCFSFFLSFQNTLTPCHWTEPYMLFPSCPTNSYEGLVHFGGHKYSHFGEIGRVVGLCSALHYSFPEFQSIVYLPPVSSCTTACILLGTN